LAPIRSPNPYHLPQSRHYQLFGGTLMSLSNNLVVMVVEASLANLGSPWPAHQDEHMSSLRFARPGQAATFGHGTGWSWTPCVLSLRRCNTEIVRGHSGYRATARERGSHLADFFSPARGYTTLDTFRLHINLRVSLLAKQLPHELSSPLFLRYPLVPIYCRRNRESFILYVPVSYPPRPWPQAMNLRTLWPKASCRRRSKRLRIFSSGSRESSSQTNSARRIQNGSPRDRSGTLSR
jgi:hypothetical protein